MTKQLPTCGGCLTMSRDRFAEALLSFFQAWQDDSWQACEIMASASPASDVLRRKATYQRQIGAGRGVLGIGVKDFQPNEKPEARRAPRARREKRNRSR
jgi:hypothetical protein